MLKIARSSWLKRVKISRFFFEFDEKKFMEIVKSEEQKNAKKISNEQRMRSKKNVRPKLC